MKVSSGVNVSCAGFSFFAYFWVFITVLACKMSNPGGGGVAYDMI